MAAASFVRALVGIVIVTGLLLADDRPPPPRDLSQPLPVALARPRLLMNMINAPVFQSIDRILRSRNVKERSWPRIANQALLMAENGNLLLLRPPPGKLAGDWLDHATTFRMRAVDLSHAAAKQDWEAAREALTALGRSCTRCHQKFHVPIQVEAMARPPIRSTTTGLAIPLPPAVPEVPEPPSPPAPPAVPQPPSPP